MQQPLFLKQIVELVLSTQVQVLAVLEIGVVRAARDAYRTEHGLSSDGTDSGSEEDGEDDYDDDSENASASSSDYDATLASEKKTT